MTIIPFCYSLKYLISVIILWINRRICKYINKGYSFCCKSTSYCLYCICKLIFVIYFISPVKNEKFRNVRIQ